MSLVYELAIQQMQQQGSKVQIFTAAEDSKRGIPLRTIVITSGTPTYSSALHMSRLCGGLMGNPSHHIKKSVELIRTINTLYARTREILFSFSVTPLACNVQTGEALLLKTRHIDQLPWNYSVTSNFFPFQSQRAVLLLNRDYGYQFANLATYY